METDELAQHLESLRREDCYRVEAVLKRSEAEETQRVFFVGSNGSESGPYIRKYIKRGYDMGGAYERIFEAQRDGRRFKHIPDVLECYAKEDCLVVVMECVRGHTLQEEVGALGPSLGLAQRTFPLLCNGADELHCEFDPPIIHRDLKPSNAILTGSGLVLIDFGISRVYREGAEEDTAHYGTRQFAPPEQYGFGQTTVASDAYSLGMVLFFCLTGRVPDASDRNREFRDPSVPESVRRVIARAVDLDPAERFPSASELKQAFLSAASSEGQGQGEGDRSRLNDAKRKQRVPAPVKAIAVALTAICIVGAMALGAGSRSGADMADDADSSQGEKAGHLADDAESNPEAQANESPEQLTDDITESFEISAPLKNGFDEATNNTITIADLEFQIPSYFRERSGARNADGYRYFYAERGSSIAMIMTCEEETEGFPEAAAAVADELFDSFQNGMLKTDEIYKVTASATYDLAGCCARFIVFDCDFAGKIKTATTVAFFKPGSTKFGYITFGQSTNVQFDYSADFAKVVASARPATS